MTSTLILAQAVNFGLELGVRSDAAWLGQDLTTLHFFSSHTAQQQTSIVACHTFIERLVEHFNAGANGAQTLLAQTNNNLLMWDTRSGDIVQQINHSCEISRRKLEPLPLVEMTWKSYQTLFPGGEVLYNPFEKPLERLLDVLMPLDEAHSGEDWMFNTVGLDDTRLPSKEKVIGIKDGGEAIAFTRDYVRKVGVVNTRVGEQSIAIAHIPEHDIFVGFNRMRDGEEIEVTEVDVFGNTKDHGTLEPAFIYNGPMWAVWLHYHPDTKLLK